MVVLGKDGCGKYRNVLRLKKEPYIMKKSVLKYTNNHCLFSPKVLNKMLLVLTGRPGILALKSEPHLPKKMFLFASMIALQK